MKHETWLLVSGLVLAACAAPPRVVPYSSGPDSLMPPVQLTCEGAPIDSADCVAHSGPHLMDLDGDGLQDLVLGDFAGHIHFYANANTNSEPVYTGGQALEVNGEVARIPNW